MFEMSIRYSEYDFIYRMTGAVLSGGVGRATFRKPTYVVFIQSLMV